MKLNLILGKIVRSLCIIRELQPNHIWNLSNYELFLAIVKLEVKEVTNLIR